MVKMWIDEKTKEKIQILGTTYKKELLKYIDPENLPDFLDGGTCKCNGDCLSINTGPWNPEGRELFPHCLTNPEEKELVGTKEKELVGTKEKGMQGKEDSELGLLKEGREEGGGKKVES